MSMDLASPTGLIVPNPLIGGYASGGCPLNVLKDPMRGKQRRTKKARDAKASRAEARLKSAELQIKRQQDIIARLFAENQRLRARVSEESIADNDSFPSVLREITSRSSSPAPMEHTANLSLADDIAPAHDDDAEMLPFTPLEGSVLHRRQRFHKAPLTALCVDVEVLEADTTRETPAKNLFEHYLPKNTFYFRNEAEDEYAGWFDNERYLRHLKKHPMQHTANLVSMEIQTPLQAGGIQQPVFDDALVYPTSEDEAMMGWC